MRKIILLFCLLISSTYAQIKGCTDSLSKNFNPKATINDGSCLYAKTKIKPEYTIMLSDSLKETSGLIAFNDILWTHNDDHDKTIYGINNKGIIKHKILLENVINNDWEEISQDSTYLYIGDFGNNYRGNRTDFKILKIEKKSFLSKKPLIDTISFSYSDQKDFSNKSLNTTNFDCEAFIVTSDSIYLFTKQWSKNYSGVYILPKNSGKHIAVLKETLKVEGLITGATFIPSKNVIVLCGYSKKMKPFLYLLYDYKDYNFSPGNKRKIDISLPFHQIEGIATQDGSLFYLTNEAFIRKPFINTPQKIYPLNLSSYLNP